MDALIKIPLINYDATERENTRKTSYENYCVDKLYGNMLPLTYLIIDKYQQKDKKNGRKTVTHKLS